MMLTGENGNTEGKTSFVVTILPPRIPVFFLWYVSVYEQFDSWERHTTVRRTTPFVYDGTWDENYDFRTQGKIDVVCCFTPLAVLYKNKTSFTNLT
jgi:ABC-type thiamine transport system substrate-binding protein